MGPKLSLCLLLLVGGSPALAAQGTGITPPIPPQPEILDRIRSLKSNEACFLPAPRILENLGSFAEGWHQMKKYGPGGATTPSRWPGWRIGSARSSAAPTTDPPTD